MAGATQVVGERGDRAEVRVVAVALAAEHRVEGVVPLDDDVFGAGAR